MPAMLNLNEAVHGPNGSCIDQETLLFPLGHANWKEM
jgi:hypothetical protein